MKVTFVSYSKVLGYRPGRIYTDELYPLLEAVLRKDVHLRLIDPPTLDGPPTTPKEVLNGSSKNIKSPNPAKGAGQDNRRSSGDRPSTESGEHPKGDSIVSPPVGWEPVVHGRSTGENVGRETSE